MSILLWGCLKHSAPDKATLKQTYVAYSLSETSSERSLLSFHRLRVEGRINLNLHMDGSRPRIRISGDPVDLAFLRTEVSKDTLKIYLTKHGYIPVRPITIDVYGTYLTHFDYQGAGKIIGRSFQGKRLSLNINNSGPTTISGSIHLQKLVAAGGGYLQISGIRSLYLQLDIQDKTRTRLQGKLHLATLTVGQQSWLSMYWVKSAYLTIRAKDNAVVRLAGAVDRLDVELWNHAKFDGRYLRAERPYVKTHDLSVATIVATKHQHTLAMDSSDIYFYNLPQTKTDFMAHDGSVLDMRDWNDPEIQEYTRYNK